MTTTPLETILIQLIGEQTIPNIIPVNVIKPNTVYNLCSGKTQQAGLRVNKWINYKYLGNIKAHLKKLDDADLFLDTRQKCAELLAQHADKRIILNVTGGNKLMSLAMHQAAEGADNVSIIYVQHDKDKENLIYPIKTAAGESANWAVQPDAELTITELLELGEQPVAYESIKDWRPCVPAARAIQQLADRLSTEGLNKNIRGDNKNRRLLRKLRRACLKDAELAASFAAAGCTFTQNSANETYNTPFLSGMWWEVLVADYLERTGKYREVMCSVKTFISEECGLTDVDVLATDGIKLTCFSCKRKLDKPDSELNKHASRSRKLGGIHANSGIAVYQGSDESYGKLKALAEASRMECLIGPDVCPDMQPATPPAEDILAQLQEQDCSTESFLG